MSEETRAGMAAIIGLPNAGKSSLLNRFLESKLSIVTSAAQTTRERVVGIDTRDGVQIVFMDTPGVVDPAYLLHRSMLSIIDQTVEDADVVVLLLDGTRDPPALPAEIEQSIGALGDRLIVAINKIDESTPPAVQRLGDWTQQRFATDAVQVSAETGDGVTELRAAIADRLPISPYLYPDDEISTQTLRFFASELIRETVFEQYREEIPYSVAVRVEEFREAEDPVLIRATVLVERGSQKSILIGKKGTAIRELGTAAREKIEEFLQRPVYLDLWIKVLPKWRKNPAELRRLGFPVPET